MRSALAVVALAGVALAPPPPSSPSGKKGAEDPPDVTSAYVDTRPPRRPFAFLEPTELTAYFHAPFRPKDDPQFAPLAEEYRALFPGVRISNGLFPCLYAIDPKGLTAFRKFADERLDPHFLKEDCEKWMGYYFTPTANPFVYRARPQRYHLAVPAEPRRSSLLLYEWHKGRYLFHLQQSANGSLLRVRLSDGPTVPGGSIPGLELVEMLRTVLSDFTLGEDPTQGRRAIAPGRSLVHISARNRVKAGAVFANHAFPYPCNDWPANVVGFVTREDVCILLFNKDGRAQQCGPWPDGLFLPLNLYDRDGRLTIERLMGKPYPRPKVGF